MTMHPAANTLEGCGGALAPSNCSRLDHLSQSCTKNGPPVVIFENSQGSCPPPQINITVSVPRGIRVCHGERENSPIWWDSELSGVPVIEDHTL